VADFTTPGIQTYTIGTSGTYDITADGAEGGSTLLASGGSGAAVSGDVYLQAGTKLEIVVGGEGGNSTIGGGGGGGGSFVIETYNGSATVDTILAVAGGGGGAAIEENGGAANTSPTGGNGSGSTTQAAGGINGAAGQGGYVGGGGGGFTGGAGWNDFRSNEGGPGTVTGTTFAGGSAGQDGGAGGVGGGGGGTGIDGYGGGGGGGYGGGGGGSVNPSYGAGGLAAGGGGGSYLDTALVTNGVKTANANTGNGSVTLEPVCFLRGTRIRTVVGDKAVESLTVGESVLTASGEERPILWIGSRGLDCSRHPKPNFVWPILIEAGAFGENLPARDLWMSPFHSILVEGVLVQVEKLVNGATIVQVPRERVEYWHVELESHDILLAEGLPAESYLDVGNRTGFVNGGDYLEAYPDFFPKHERESCVPVVKEGPVIERTKTALLARAKALGYALTDDADVHVMADDKRIDPVSLGEKRLAFLLPVAGSNIELRCRSFIPAHINPENTDQRSLGICVSRLQLDGAEVALEDEVALLHGWHPLERNAQGESWRWSQERMGLPAGTRLVIIDRCHEGRHYWAEPANAAIALFG
jgi:hypothetical protein